MPAPEPDRWADGDELGFMSLSAYQVKSFTSQGYCEERSVRNRSYDPSQHPEVSALPSALLTLPLPWEGCWEDQTNIF